MPLPVATVLAGGALLFLATVPLGCLLLRAAERFLGHPLNLSVPERLILAPYLAVALLIAIASLPVPIYGAPLLVFVLLVGGGGLAALAWRDRASGLRSVAQWCVTVPGLAILLGTLALSFVEVYSIATLGFPNVFDGSFQTLYVKLILSGHTLPWTLRPFANFGVVYPPGAAVWMTLPVLLFGWPILTAPVVLPPLFLGLSGAAAFCWGSRLGGLGTRRGTAWGLLFAGFYGLIASWPRLFVGGSYDFVYCLPLFFLTLGWIRPFVESHARSWRDVVAFGVLLGVLTSLSLAIGELLVVLVAAFVLVYHPPGRLSVRQWLARGAVVLAVGAAFVSRSIAALVIWYAYPGHVLSAAGNPPYAASAAATPPSFDLLSAELYPFVPFKWKLSPIPIVSVELAVLLVFGLGLSFLCWALRRSILSSLLPTSLLVPVYTATAGTFLWTLFLSLETGTPPFASILDPLTSFYETSFLLFMFYQTIALIPLVALLEFLRRARSAAPREDPSPTTRIASPAPGTPRRRTGGRGSTSGTVLVVLLLLVPFAVGAGTTVAAVPSFLSSHMQEFTNVSLADVVALTWAGAHLPSCSVVLVAPGSAGEFLPLYATVQVDFPMVPEPANLSYSVAVANLTAGLYSFETASALSSLGVTEVFVTGQTSVSYVPFDPQALLNTTSFSVLLHVSDAYIFGFVPGISASACTPT